MRKLTLHEKISLKGLFACKGIKGICGLNMSESVHWYTICFGGGISTWYKKKFKKNSQLY